MEKKKEDLPYDLRPSRSGPAVLKGFCPNLNFDNVQCVNFAYLRDNDKLNLVCK